jgi:hypothetical protein
VRTIVEVAARGRQLQKRSDGRTLFLTGPPSRAAGREMPVSEWLFLLTHGNYSN